MDKSDDKIKAEENMNEREITLIEARKIGDTCLEVLKTESDQPSNHPELETRFQFWIGLCGLRN